MTIDLSAAFADAIGLWRSRRDLILRIAPPFLFLPTFAAALLGPAPAAAPPGGTEDSAAALARLSETLAANAPWVVANAVIGIIGSAMIYSLLLRPDATVAQTLRASLPRALLLFVADLLIQLGFFVGFLLFIVPGLYFYGRTLLAEPALVAEGKDSPIDAIKRSIELSRGCGFLLMFAGTAVFVTVYAAMLFLSGLRDPLAGSPVAMIFVEAAGAAIGMFGSVVGILLRVALYRRLAGSSSGI